MSLSISLLEEGTYFGFIRGRKANSFGVPRIYAIDNIHGQKYSAAYELSRLYRDVLE